MLKGAGRFADDVTLPNQAHAFFLRSPHAHARIESVDTTAAAAMPSVIAIVTGNDLVRDGVRPIPNSADFKRADGAPCASPPRHSLAVGSVRFVGEAIAVVIAATSAEAQDAAEAIDVRYVPLPAVTGFTAALAPGAPLRGTTRPATSPPKRATATPPLPPLHFAARRTSSRSTSRINGSRPAPSSRARSFAATTPQRIESR